MRFPIWYDESQTSKFFNQVQMKGLGRSFEIMTESSEDPEKSIDFLQNIIENVSGVASK